MRWRRVRAIFIKELREYRRNLNIISAMTVVPLVFLILPLLNIFGLKAAAAGQLSHAHVLIYMLGIPAITPSLVAAYSVVGERLQGTLEPVLSSPIRREELLLGKALAAFVPSVAIAYAVFALVLALVALLAQPAIASALHQGPDILVQLLFTPILAVSSIWASIAVSTRVSDARTAQQLATLAGVPAVLVSTLVAVDVISPTRELVIGAGILLLVIDIVGYRVASALFDRERLIAGSR